MVKCGETTTKIYLLRRGQVTFERVNDASLTLDANDVFGVVEWLLGCAALCNVVVASDDAEIVCISVSYLDSAFHLFL